MNMDIMKNDKNELISDESYKIYDHSKRQFKLIKNISITINMNILQNEEVFLNEEFMP